MDDEYKVPFKASDWDTLVRIEQLLTAQGYTVSRTPEAVILELKAFGGHYATVYCVPVRPFFEEKVDGCRPYSAFQYFQGDLLHDAFQQRPSRDLYLYLIGDEALIEAEAHQSLRWQIEPDTSLAQKAILTFEELPEWLANPFGQLMGGARANTVPTVTMVRDLDYTQDPVTPATHSFDPHAILKALEQQELPLTDMERQCVQSLFRRIMGPVYQLHWTEEGATIAKSRTSAGVPLWLASSGERLALAYAIFLAQASRNVAKGMCVGIYNALNALDILKQFFAFDALRDLVIATGASVYFQSVKNDSRTFVERKMARILEKLTAAAAV